MDRIAREKATVANMIGIYCRRRHSSPKGQLCDDCAELLGYAMKRLEHCPKGNTKSSCRKCEIHCYSLTNREKIRNVMRYVGPRMIFIHPVAAIRHIITELK